MKVSKKPEKSSGFQDLLTYWFFGLLAGAGIWSLILSFLMGLLIGGMSWGAKPGQLNLPLLAGIFLCIVLSPFSVILIESRSWRRALVGGLIADSLAPLIFGLMVAIDWPGRLGGIRLGNSIEAAIDIAASAIVAFAVISFASEKKPGRTFWGWLIAGILLGGTASIGSIRLLELYLGQEDTDFFLVPCLATLPLAWLYSAFFTKFLARRLPWGKFLVSLLLTLVLTAATLILPVVVIRLFLPELLQFSARNNAICLPYANLFLIM